MPAQSCFVYTPIHFSLAPEQFEANSSHESFINISVSTSRDRIFKSLIIILLSLFKMYNKSLIYYKFYSVHIFLIVLYNFFNLVEMSPQVQRFSFQIFLSSCKFVLKTPGYLTRRISHSLDFAVSGTVESSIVSFNMNLVFCVNGQLGPEGVNLT